MKQRFHTQKIRIWLSAHWHGLVAGMIIAMVASVTLGMQLSTLVDGQTTYETATVSELSNFPNPTERMINAPYLLPAYILGTQLDSLLNGARITSAIYAIFATGALFFVLKRWFSVQIASITSLLFVTSSWVLALSHQATPLILLVFTPLFLLMTLSLFVSTRNHIAKAFVLLCLSIVYALYVPYMLWLVGIIVVATFTLYKGQLRAIHKKTIAVTAFVCGVLLLPLIISLVSYPGQMKELLGVPQYIPSFSEYASNWLHQISTLFFVAKPFPELYVGRLALLDIFSVTMVALGTYYIVRYMPTHRRMLLGVAIGILVFLVPLQTPFQLAMALYIPFIYIAIASGIYELLKQWFTYFPRNPFARNTAVVLVALLIGLSTLYNLQRFYIAWPNTSETNAVYVVQSNKE